MNRDVHICRATNESAEMEFDPMKMFCPLLKLMVPPLVVAATTAAYAQPGLSCADWRLEPNGWWHPSHEVIIGNVVLGTNYFIDQNAIYIISGTNIIATLNRNCGRRRGR